MGKGAQLLKGHNRQHRSNVSKYSKLKKIKKYYQSGQLRYVVKCKVIKMAQSRLKHHCYCPMLLMRTTKTAVCLQTKAILYHLYGVYLMF